MTDENALTAFVHELRDKRKQAGLTIVEVADRMSVLAKDVDYFEKLVLDPDLRFIQKYAFAVGVMVSFTVQSRPRPTPAVLIELTDFAAHPRPRRTAHCPRWLVAPAPRLRHARGS